MHFLLEMTILIRNAGNGASKRKEGIKLNHENKTTTSGVRTIVSLVVPLEVIHVVAAAKQAT
jgi:hypothetical protein